MGVVIDTSEAIVVAVVEAIHSGDVAALEATARRASRAGHRSDRK